MVESSLGLSEVVYVGPECRGVFAGSPAIVKVAWNKNTSHTSRSTLLSSHDFFGATTLNDTVQVLQSTDGGTHWRQLSNVTGMYWANLFLVDSNVYMFGVAGDDIHKISPPNKVPLKGGPVVIAKSTDDGTTWSKPSILFPGSFQTAPTPVVESNGVIYRTMEESSSSSKGTDALMLWVRVCT